MPLLFYPRLFGNDAAVIGSGGGGGTAPATPTLSVVDNGDGTGAVATIVGSTAGSTNTVSTAPWSNAGNDLSWTAAPARIGDGAVSLSLPDGFYAARCASVLSGLPAAEGNEPLFQVTGGATYSSAHKALAETVATRIRSMLGTNIIGVLPDSVRTRKTAFLADFSGQAVVPASMQHALPAIIICYFDQEEIDPNLGTNARDEIGYPITIVFAREGQSANTFCEDGDDLFLTWRQAVERTFTNLRGYSPGSKLTVTVTPAGGGDAINYTFHKCLPRGGMIYDPDRANTANKKMDVGWLRFSFRLWRGALGS